MAINPITPTTSIIPVAKSADTKKPVESKTVSKNKSGATVALSAKFQELNNLIENSPDPFDLEAVSAIKDAIANNTFKVDSGKVADGIIAASLAMVSEK